MVPKPRDLCPSSLELVESIEATLEFNDLKIRTSDARDAGNSIVTTLGFGELEIHQSDSSFEVVFDLRSSLSTRATSVQFALEQNEIFEVMGRGEITSEEKSSLWYRKSELKSMRRRAGKEDKGDMLGIVVHDEVIQALHCLMAVSVVLDEQDRQRKEHVHDPHSIAKKYVEFVSRSRRSLFITHLVKQEEKNKTLGKPLALIPQEGIQDEDESEL